MPDMTAIASALSALKGMKDIAEAMIGLRDAKVLQEKRLEFQARIIDAQSGILAAQEERSMLIDRVRDLEKQIAEFETWDTEKQRYELKRVAPGAFAYSMKPDAGGAEPPHWICTACYQNRKKSLLQEMPMRVPQPGGLVSVWECPACSAKIRVPFGAGGPV
jgi:hypothetical protein